MMEINDKNNFKTESSFLLFWKNKMKELSLFKNRSRKKLQISLQESEKIYRTLIENTLESIAVFQNGEIILCNSAFCSMLGYTMEEASKIGLRLIAPEDRQRLTEIHYKRMQGELEKLNYSGIFLHKSGARLTLDINSSTVKINGQYSSFITMRDITKRIAMEQALRESEAKYKTLVENSLDGITIIRNNRILFANTTFCKMLNYTIDELYNMPSINTMHPGEYEKALKIAERRKNMDATTIKEVFKMRTKEGEIKECETSSTLIEFEGEWASFFTSHDITERKKNEEELRLTKEKLQKLNIELENKVQETAEKLTEVNTQLIMVQKESLQSQFDVLKQQVNPHFLFNSLNVLTSLIKLDPDLAEKFSENLSKVYRYVLENKDNELVDLKTELQFLDAYILLLNIRFIDKLRVNINIPDNRMNDLIIPLAMQLLIENAIKHNVMSKSVPLTIEIFIDNDNFLNIVNNLNERPSQLISTGIGLKNIENRYLLLNNTKPVFEKTPASFIARVPLVIKY
jgi:PAS domain S-box-containing protein